MSESLDVGIEHALSLLQSMKGEEWTESQAERYSVVLDQIAPDLRFRAIVRLTGEKWRPAPADIMREAARIELCYFGGTEQPFPTADECYAEIVQKMHRYGANALAVPDHPNLRLPGAPPFSHPLVARTVAIVGGWECICSGEANYAEGLSKQVKATYERQAEQWMEKVTRCLHLPFEERNPKLFPAWNPFEIPDDWEDTRPTLRLLTPPPDPLPAAPCPPEIRKRLAAMGVNLGGSAPEQADKPRRVRSEQLRRIAQGLTEKRGPKPTT